MCSKWAVPVTAVATSVAVSVSTACSRPRGSAAAPPQTAEAARRAGADAAIALRQEFRKLWTDHVIWMRGVIVATAGDQPDAQEASARLIRNQEEIGTLVGRYYGRSTGDQLTALLKEHVWSTVEVLRAAKVGDEGAEERATDRAERNAAKIADFLSQANPNWSRGRVHELFKDQLEHANEEIDARIGKRWDADVKTFDASHKQVLRIADAFSEGIVRQYPEKFGG